MSFRGTLRRYSGSMAVISSSTTPIAIDEDKRHREYMRKALDLVTIQHLLGRGLSAYWLVQAEMALASDEVPVGCIFVCKDEIIGEGMNDTNRSLNVHYRVPVYS